MADVKASELISWIKEHLGDGYVYGTVGQICTIDLLKVKQRQYGGSMGDGYYQKNGDYTKGKCARWLGDWVADCSGLIKAARKAISGVWRDVSAQGTYEQCQKKGKIGTMPHVPGCTVYMWSSSRRRMGHVGVYIGNGEVIEARGVSYGVVKTSFKARAWGYWGLLDWLELDLPEDGSSNVPDDNADPGGSDGAGQMPDDQPCDGVPNLAAIGDTGDDIKMLQRWLNLHGAAPQLVVDGIFGSKSDAAVTAFKQKHGLAHDGVTCIQTWTALIVPPPAVALELKTISLRDTGILVQLVQRLLYTAGLTPWGIDGIFGTSTDETVRTFQASKGLVVDGIVGTKTWAALTGNTEPAIPRTLRLGDSGSDVTYLQKTLESKHFSPGAIDGIFGTMTERAVIAFQRVNGLVTDGIVGPHTWGKLLGIS